MKKFMLVDDVTSKRGAEYVNYFEDLETALANADLEWSRMADSDKKDRDEFYVAELDVTEEVWTDLTSESGDLVCYDYMTDVVKRFE